ncbi:MAG: hypothetical protein WA634_03340 [Silvibacterium sp.]
MPIKQPDDGTRQLLQAGIWTLATGVLAALLVSTVFGGIGVQGPHTNSGWIFLLIALACVPFGLMALALGVAKWFRNRRIALSAPKESALPLNSVSRDTKSLLSFSEHSMEHRSHGKERQ